MEFLAAVIFRAGSRIPNCSWRNLAMNCQRIWTKLGNRDPLGGVIDFKYYQDRSIEDKFEVKDKRDED